MFDYLVKRNFENVEFRGNIVFINIDGVKVVFEGTKSLRKYFKLKCLCEAISTLPINVKKFVAKNVGLIRLEGMSEKNYRRCLGFYRFADKAILIRYNTTNKTIVSTLYHEIGHLIDNTLSIDKDCRFKSIKDSRFHDIAVKEGDYYGYESYYMSNICEYFAESFARFFLNKGFKRNCPNTYILINDYLTKI